MSSRPGLRDNIGCCSIRSHTLKHDFLQTLFFFCVPFKPNLIRHNKSNSQIRRRIKRFFFNPSFSSQFPAWVILFIYENDGAIPFLNPICTRYENGLLCYFMNSPYIFCMGNGSGCKSHVTLSFKNSYIYIIKMGSTRITHL